MARDKTTSQLQILHLRISKSDLASPDFEQRIICILGKTVESRHCGETGRKCGSNIAELKYNTVHKIIRIIGHDCEFKYYNTHECYKRYTSVRDLRPIW